MSERIVEFVRQKELVFERELGRGACGITALLYDETIDEHFVCKKYAPAEELMKSQLFGNFIGEIKLLHLLNHPNVVRVFNYYIYPKDDAGYILMEYVEGTDIEEYISHHPQALNELFRQAVSGFRYLEDNGILHRDIRPSNLLVSDAGELKIIDFGFGKWVSAGGGDFDKSVTLNWWCDTPAEFNSDTYDFSTEVYFLGQLFKKILADVGIEHFQYTGLLSKMCEFEPKLRVQSFIDAEQAMLAAGFGDIPFTEDEVAAYRKFSDALFSTISKVDTGTKYITDGAEVLRKLEDTCRRTLLEESLPKNTLLIRCFLNGAYYFAQTWIDVATVKRFLDLFRSCSVERQQIILSNLYARLDALDRYDANKNDYNDLPF